MEHTKSTKRLRFPVNEQDITARIAELAKNRRDTPYAKQKSALEEELSVFLSNLTPVKDFPSCSPLEIVKFLIWKDQAGRTQIHKDQCPFFGRKGLKECACPRRLASGTVDSMIGKLRAIFSESNRVGEWDPILNIGNPASGMAVKQYLANVRSEQLQARITPAQAKPFLVSHLITLCQFLHTKLAGPPLTPQETFMLARDQAFFKALFYSGDRAADLLHVKTPEILRFPDNSGLLFNHMWTKTLRNGDVNVFAFRRGQHSCTCPVQGIEVYLKIAASLQVDIYRSYLFRSLTKEGKVSHQGFTSAAAQARLKTYCGALAVKWKGQNFTLHSLRGGAAVSLALSDIPIHQIMDHIGWKSSKQAMHYIRLRQVMNPAGPAAKLADLNPKDAEHFDQWDSVEGFVQAFQR